MTYRLIITVDLYVDTKEEAKDAAVEISAGIWDAAPQFPEPEVVTLIFEDHKLIEAIAKPQEADNDAAR